MNVIMPYEPGVTAFTDVLNRGGEPLEKILGRLEKLEHTIFELLEAMTGLDQRVADLDRAISEQKRTLK